MKKTLLLLLSTVFVFNVNAQTGICNDFSTNTGLSSNGGISYSVAGNELTITLTNCPTWSDNLKWDFPNAINISSLASPTVSYDVKVNSLTVSGTGAGCAVANYVSFGIAVYDGTASGGSDYTWSAGNASAGHFASTYSNFATAINKTSPSTFDATNIVGVAFQIADPTYATCSSPTLTGTIVIKNLNIGSATCTTPIMSANPLFTTNKLYPNPTSEMAQLEFELKSESNVKVTLSDMMGKEIMTISEGNMSSLNKSFSVATLNKGIYTINYFINGTSTKSELLMVK